MVKNRWYKLKGIGINLSHFLLNKDEPIIKYVKFLGYRQNSGIGTDNYAISMEFLNRFNFSHNGETDDGNTGRIGYCMYTSRKWLKLKEITDRKTLDKIMVEIL